MSSDDDQVRVVAPGRVNLIGEHTDGSGGLVLPMAIDLATTVVGTPGGDTVHLRSADEPEPAVLPLEITDPTAADPPWARYVAGVIAEVGPTTGFTGRVTTTLPVGSGLSSSAALEVAVALALDGPTNPLDLAQLAQRAEQRASGVPCGIMDQLASTAGVEGHALLIDCATLEVTPVPIPDELEIRVVHSGQHRQLAGSAYAERARSVAEAEAIVGPLRNVAPAGLEAALERLDDPVLARRARHVVTENERVRVAVEALANGDTAALGEALAASHRSLRDDFEVSTDALDALVERLGTTPGVIGVRLTGAGFGGCVVAVTEPGAIDEGWRVRPSGGARLVS